MAEVPLSALPSTVFWRLSLNVRLASLPTPSKTFLSSSLQQSTEPEAGPHPDKGYRRQRDQDDMHAQLGQALGIKFRDYR